MAEHIRSQGVDAASEDSSIVRRPHQHRLHSRSRSRSREPHLSGRRDNSHHHHQHHHHRHYHHRDSHNRHRSRSHSPSPSRRSHHKRHHTRSPTPPSRHSHRDLKEPRPRSPRPAQPGSVAARRPYSPHSQRRPRSRSLESRYSTDSWKVDSRRAPPEERSYRREDEEATYHRRSPRAGYQRGNSRASPSYREYRSGRGEERGNRRSNWEEAEYNKGSGRSSAYAQGQSSTDHDLRRSPIREPRRRSRDSLGRAIRPGDSDRSTSRSLSRERGSRAKPHNEEKEPEMYSRGGGYHQGYNNNNYGPPAQSPYGRPGYNQPPYQSYAGSGPMHGYPSHQAHQSQYPYHGGHSQQSHGPQYQPQPGFHSNRPPFPPRDGPPRGGMRGGPAGRGGRGHFANMSWTPSEGTKGGHIVQPGDKPRTRDDAPQSAPQSRQQPSSSATEDHDNPFRPPADLRAEDEELARKRKAPSPIPSREANDANTSSNNAPEKDEVKPKISFSIKGRATQAATERAAPLKPDTSPLLDRKLPVLDSPLTPIPAPVPKSRLYVGNTRVETPRKPSPPLFRKEIVRKKRIKARPQLSDDHAQSESVYYRKPGNESVSTLR